MTRGSIILAMLAASYLVAACSDDGSGTGSNGAGGPVDAAATSVAAATTSSPTSVTTIADLPSTTTTTPPTTAAPITPAPTAAPPTQAVTIQPQTSTPRTRCEAAADPPATATALQATFADVDADTRPDVIWIYDAPDGTHLHLRTGRGATDDIVLAYGQGAVAVGSAQVDLAVGAPEPGAADEILAVTSDGDGRRLVGVYGFAINTGCLESFTFNQGAPFVYLVSRNGSLSGLRCVSDGVTGHLEGLTAVPSSGGDAFATTRLVFGRLTGRRLVPITYESGSLPGPADDPTLLATGDVSGCTLSTPAF